MLAIIALAFVLQPILAQAPSPSNRPGDAQVVDSKSVPGSGLAVDLAVCRDEILVLRGGELHRLPRRADAWDAPRPAPAGTVAIAGHGHELWAVAATGLLTALEPASGRSRRQFQLPPRNPDEPLAILALAFDAASVVVSTRAPREGLVVGRRDTFLRRARDQADATWHEVGTSNREPCSIAIDEAEPGLMVVQGDCVVWLDRGGVPARAALLPSTTLAFACDGDAAVALILPRAARGEETALRLQRLRLEPRPALRIVVVREGSERSADGRRMVGGVTHWTVDGVRCDAAEALAAAVQRIEGWRARIALVTPGNGALYVDVAETAQALRRQKLPVVFW